MTTRSLQARVRRLEVAGAESVGETLTELVDGSIGTASEAVQARLRAADIEAQRADDISRGRLGWLSQLVLRAVSPLAGVAA